MINRDEVMGLGVAINRTPEMHAAYKASIDEKHEAHGPDMPCPFCRGIPGGLRDDEIIDEHNGIYIVRNAYSYTAYNGQEVEDHRLVVPPQHVSDTDEMTEPQARAFNDAMTHLRVVDGMTMMMRSNKDKSKSVPHAHGHGFTLGRRVIFQLYDPERGTNDMLFEGEESKIPDVLARAAFVLGQKPAGDLV